MELHEDSLDNFQEPIGGIGTVKKAASSVGGELYVLHGLRRHPGGAGCTSETRRKTFCYVDNVCGIDIQTITFNEAILGVTGMVNVPGTPKRVSEMLNDELEAELLAPISSTDQNIKIIVVRKSMFCPFELVSLYSGKRLSPREAFQLTYAKAAADETIERYLPWLDFLTVACIKSTANANKSKVQHDELGLAMPAPTPEVIAYCRTHVLHVQLPALKPYAGPASDPAVQSMATGIHNLVAESRKDHMERVADRQRAVVPKTVREKWDDCIADKLNQMCDIQNDTNLPELYQDWANRTSGISERYLFQTRVGISAEELGCTAPRVSPTQTICVRNWQFHGEGLGQLGTGILPLSVTPLNCTSPRAQRALAEDQANAETFDRVGDPNNSQVGVADMSSLRNPNGYFPQNWTKATLQLKAYVPLLAAVVGDNHNNVDNLLEFFIEYKRLLPRLMSALDAEYGQALGPIVIVLYIQLKMRRWFERQNSVRSRGVLPAPNLASGLDDFDGGYNLSWLPTIDNIPALVAIRDGQNRCQNQYQQQQQLGQPATHPRSAQQGAATRQCE